MYQEKIFYSKNREGAYLKYCYRPNNGQGKQPLLIHIHGAGSRGDNLSVLGNSGFFKKIESREDLKATVVMPLCHCDTWFELFDVLLEFIDYCRNAEDVDSNRVYLCGGSMGAYCAWQVAMSRPDWFAALVPICGGGMYWNAARLKDLPIWAFHGALDDTVLPEESIHMVAAVNRNGGNAKITVYPDVAHASWVNAYADDAMWEWMFSQKR
jgi:predicted peptidase